MQAVTSGNPEIRELDTTIVEDRIFAGQWRVEAIDMQKEGVVYVSIFAGPDAQARAREYAIWKYGY